jgi:hypothetical protein
MIKNSYLINELNLTIVANNANNNAKKYFNIIKSFELFNHVYFSEINKINYSELTCKSIVIFFEHIEYSSYFEMVKLIRVKKSKIGLFCGDSAQYLNNIYQYYLASVDFILTHELGESTLYENKFGLPAFDHPIFQPTILLNQKTIKSINFRTVKFVHLGQIDPFRHGRTEMVNSLRCINVSYKLYGPNFYKRQNNYCEFIKNEDINNLLENCIFGLSPGAASISTPNSSDKKSTPFQVKGKIYEYMQAGCIPVVDFFPNADKLGLINGKHYISISKFSPENLLMILKLSDETIKEMSSNVYNKAKEILSIQNAKNSFEIFISRLYYYSLDDKINLNKSKPNFLAKAALEYSFYGKRLNPSLFYSGFYFIKIYNIIKRKLKNLY